MSLAGRRLSEQPIHRFFSSHEKAPAKFGVRGAGCYSRLNGGRKAPGDGAAARRPRVLAGSLVYSYPRV